MNKVIIISGPTATFKTRTSIDTALNIQKKLQKKVVIINFDSLLFYKEISIGSAKPTLDEKKGIEHFMIDIESIKSPMNASDFIQMGLVIIKEQLNLGHIPILIGGSAFYLRALLKGMYESPTIDLNKKDKFEKLYKENGIEEIVDYLKEHDPKSLINLHINDHYRLIRAATHHYTTGTPISLLKENLDQLNPYDFSTLIHPWNLLHLYLDLPKDYHFSLITQRTNKMFEDGLMNEIQRLEDSGFSLEEKPLQSIGYKEAIEWKKGLFSSEKDCIDRISISTRQLAKSQRTFFKKITPKLCFNPLEDQEKIFLEVERFISSC